MLLADLTETGVLQISSIIITCNNYCFIVSLKLTEPFIRCLGFKQSGFLHLYLQASEQSEISRESTVSVVCTPGREQQLCRGGGVV